MNAFRFLFVSIGVLSFITSCDGLSGRNFRVEKISPEGAYRVKVDINVEDENDLFSHFNERGKVEVFKGQEVIYANEWQRRDNWEPTFIDANPVIEWISKNALRMGSERSKQLLSNELVISNNTNESISQMAVSCGKYENFYIFDIPANSRLSLNPTPALNADVSENDSLGYGGKALSGKNFSGVLEYKKPPARNSVRLEITITTSDLKS
ncbi:MAG: hypothetical protein ACR2H6_05110 [Pyrinomonadaceae bacterium]